MHLLFIVSPPLKFKLQESRDPVGVVHNSIPSPGMEHTVGTQSAKEINGTM